jgi:hypothetical protein
MDENIGKIQPFCNIDRKPKGKQTLENLVFEARKEVERQLAEGRDIRLTLMAVSKDGSRLKADLNSIAELPPHIKGMLIQAIFEKFGIHTYVSYCEVVKHAEQDPGTPDDIPEGMVLIMGVSKPGFLRRKKFVCVASPILDDGVMRRVSEWKPSQVAGPLFVKGW